MSPGPGVTEEQRNAGVLALMTGVTSGVDDDASRPGSMLPLPVLRCGCVKGAGGLGRLIFTELCCERGNLTFFLFFYCYFRLLFLDIWWQQQSM